MMFFKVISKIKYRCLITLLGCIALLMAGCGGKDEAIILLPSGESAAEYPELEAVEQVVHVLEPAGDAGHGVLLLGQLRQLLERLG